MLVPSNNGDSSQRKYNQTCTKQPNTTLRQRETTPNTQESDLKSSIDTKQIVNYILYLFNI